MNSKMAFWTFLALFFLVVPAVAETPITGTSVLLEPPAGYRAAESYTGLENEDDTLVAHGDGGAGADSCGRVGGPYDRLGHGGKRKGVSCLRPDSDPRLC